MPSDPPHARPFIPSGCWWCVVSVLGKFIAFLIKYSLERPHYYTHMGSFWWWIVLGDALSEIDKNEWLSLLVVLLRASIPLWFCEINAAKDSFCQDFLTEIIGFATLSASWPTDGLATCSFWWYELPCWVNADETICNLMGDELLVNGNKEQGICWILVQLSLPFGTT